MNSLETFAGILAYTPIVIEWALRKVSIACRARPSRFVSVERDGERVRIEWRNYEHDRDNDLVTVSKEFVLVASDGQVSLKNGDDLFLIPEQASECILSPIVELLEQIDFETK